MIVIHSPTKQELLLPTPVQPRTLLALLQEAGVLFAAPCGGSGRCGNCRVRAYGDLSLPDAEEHTLLGEAALQQGVRLACRTKIIGPSAEIHLGSATVAIPTQSEKRLDPVQPIGRTLGLAIDLGTTTITGALYDLKSGNLLAEHSMRNPQAAYGADVISRLQAARKDAEQLADTAASAIQALTQELLSAANRTDLPDAAVLTANTAMLCLLFGYPVRSLTRAPFALPHPFGASRPLSSLLPDAHGTLYIPPCIGPFLGADLVTAILDTDLLQAAQSTALLDLGTNGELALFDGKTLACCSTAAGPALEGAGIRMGCTASAGAIHAVTMDDGSLRCHTIGNAPAIGLCGSGLLDAAACLLETSAMDMSGKLLAGDQVSFGSTDVILCQQDIRALQTAKAAIRAGLDILCETTGCSNPKLLLAGGLGNTLRTESIARIGLIPRDAAARTQSVGNAALQGAAKLLMDTGLQSTCHEIVKRAVPVDLASHPTFTERYIDAMRF